METKESKENKNPLVRLTKHGFAQAANVAKPWEQLQRDAELALSPTMSGAAVIEVFAKAPLGVVDVVAIVSGLNEQLEEIHSGKMAGPEAMLYAQATALQSIFVNLTRRAIKQEYLAHLQTFLSLALKAQAQCRCTLEALNEIKFPKSATFVKQANIANQQQVNNGVPARVESKTEQSNEQLTEGNHATVDLGGTATAGAANSELETLGEIHRTTERKRKTAKREKRH
jgi:hypothetical protein